MGNPSGDSRERIGEFLVKIGAINETEVEEILERQRGEPEKLFGEIAIELGMIDDDAIQRFLTKKH